jgi:hypothetical protein
MNEIAVPRFVNDVPIGEDLFEGKSQEKVAECLVSYIKENIQSKKRVIGIDGEWGAGKSNIIEIIKKKTNAEFHLFTFDAWGHQEDLTRRTFLEELTDDLIKNKMLHKKWADNLNLKLATNRITITKNTPEFNRVMVFLVILILISPIVKPIFEYIFIKTEVDFPGLYSSIATFAFVIVPFALCYFFTKKESRPTVEKLFFLYKGKEINTTKHETITSLEPTVREFRKILHEIVTDFDNAKKLIYVFDNIDRLPAKNVKELWSSIHTFFAEPDSQIIDTWVIVPFDHRHLCKIFNNENGSESDLTLSYIQKTFSIVFRVSPPILSDWKHYFELKFKEAFGFAPPADEQLVNLFDYLQDDNNIKPRQILDYINNLVVLKKQWGNEIPFRYFGLFLLTKSQILDNPAKVIIERSFLNNVESIFSNDNELEKYISALVFNVDITKSDEVLLRRSIEKILRGEGDFKSIYRHPAFISVLDSCYYNTEINIEKAILVFSELDDYIKNDKNVDKYWFHLNNEFCKKKLIFPDSEKYFKLLFINLPDILAQVKLISFILGEIRNYKADNNFYFRGAKFSQIIENIEEFFKTNSININVFEYCVDQVFNPIDFVSFVESSRYDYKKYKVNCMQDGINALMISTLPVEIGKYELFLEKTGTDFNYTELIQELEALIKKLDQNTSDYAKVLNSLLTIYKILSPNKPHLIKIAPSTAWELFTLDIDQPKAIDLILSFLSDELLRVSYLVNPNTVKVLKMTDKIEYAASIAEYYMNYGELILVTLESPLPMLLEIVKSLTYRQDGNSTLIIKKIIQNYDRIKTTIIKDNKDFVITFMKQLNNWTDDYKVLLNGDGFTDLLSLNLIDDCSLIKNDFTELTIVKANEYLLSRDTDEWLKAFEISNSSYLFALTIHLINNKQNTFNKLPDSTLNAYKEAILNISKLNEYPDKFNDWDQILDFFDGRKLKLTYKQIRDTFIYNAHPVPVKAMNFFEKGLFMHGGLDEKDKIEDVIRKIIIPCINDELGLENVIFQNKDKVINLIKESSEFTEEIVDALKLQANENNKEEMIAFSSALGTQFTIN